MPEYCTCGAQLPPDARFCHKCGKPQRDEPTLEVVESAPPPGPSQPASLPPPEIGLHNSLAVRIAFLVGALTFVLSSLPLPPYVGMIWLLGAGFISVLLYRRRSGHPVSVRSGARMGWITGLCCFVIFTVIFTFSFAVAAYLFREGGAGAYFAQLRALGMPEDTIRKVEQAIRYFESPAQVAAFLLSFFVMFTGLVAIGGAIGAKILSQSSSGAGGRE